jgi:hypothetical protein
MLEQTFSTLRLLTSDTSAKHYSDAQLDDYRMIPGSSLPWYPPLRLTVKARFSHPAGSMRGTAGFGFWNYPFLFPESRLPTLPRAIWFFYGSPPSNLKLDRDTPGSGWKVATIDALRPSALALAPLAPLVVPLMNIKPLYHKLWPRMQRLLAIHEALMQVEMTEWHVYTLEWGTTGVRFRVDGSPILAGTPAPHGPMCFVMWVDNQYMVVTPWGKFRWGLLDIPERQWLEVSWLAIEPGQ